MLWYVVQTVFLSRGRCNACRIENAVGCGVLGVFATLGVALRPVYTSALGNGTAHLPCPNAKACLDHTVLFGAGFTSGHIRIFDVDSAEITAVQQQHTSVVSTVLFSPGSGNRLFSIGEDGVLVMYDASQEYAPSRILNVASPGPMSMSIVCWIHAHSDE